MRDAPTQSPEDATAAFAPAQARSADASAGREAAMVDAAPSAARMGIGADAAQLSTELSTPEPALGAPPSLAPVTTTATVSAARTGSMAASDAKSATSAFVAASDRASAPSDARFDKGATVPRSGTDADGLENLIVCPTCDALYHQTSVPMGAKGICQRCGTTLAAPRERAMTRVVMLAATSLVLMVGAVFFPFLQISAAGMHRSSSVLDAVLIFADGVTLPLTIAVGAFIILLPSLRLALLIYALAPMALGDRPARHAIPAFRWAEALRPWAMAEIFVIGVAVALVKVAGLAKLSLGVAFWAFVLLVLVNVLNDNFMCRLTVWRTLEQRSRS